MSAFEPQARPGMRRSHKVALVLLGTAGVVGAASIYDVWRRERDLAAASANAAAKPIAEDQTYRNDEYIPGVGYYHAPFFAWFPYRFNHHDPARGYFAGGQWHPQPAAAGMTQSRPSAPAVMSALAARQQFASQTAAGARAQTSHVTSPPAPTRSTPGILRGGFGSFARPAGT